MLVMSVQTGRSFPFPSVTNSMKFSYSSKNLCIFFSSIALLRGDLDFFLDDLLCLDVGEILSAMAIDVLFNSSVVLCKFSTVHSSMADSFELSTLLLRSSLFKGAGSSTVFVYGDLGCFLSTIELRGDSLCSWALVSFCSSLLNSFANFNSSYSCGASFTSVFGVLLK